MIHDGFANSVDDSRRRSLFDPLAIEDQFVIRTKKKVHTDLPFAAAPRVKMRRQMVRGVEPKIQAVEDNRVYLPHARLFIEPPEYEYTPDRTLWQSLAPCTCPVLLTSGLESAFTVRSRHPGEGQPKTTADRPATMTHRGTRCRPFSLVFRASHSTITRSHSTCCELLTSGTPRGGSSSFRHLFGQKSIAKRVPCLTAFRIRANQSRVFSII
jgi:hypothetical protein